METENTSWMNQPRFSADENWHPSMRRPLAPHMQPLADEKANLDERITKLADFIDNNYLFRQNSENEQRRMREQLRAMRIYSDVLGERINNPTPG